MKKLTMKTQSHSGRFPLRLEGKCASEVNPPNDLRDPDLLEHSKPGDGSSRPMGSGRLKTPERRSIVLLAQAQPQGRVYLARTLAKDKGGSGSVRRTEAG
jgi:hypothetical protein